MQIPAIIPRIGSRRRKIIIITRNSNVLQANRRAKMWAEMARVLKAGVPTHRLRRHRSQTPKGG